MLSSTKRNQLIVLAGSIAAASLVLPAAHARGQQSGEASVAGNSSSPMVEEKAQTLEFPALWQELRFGMSPEEALLIIRAIPGISKARLYRRRDSDDPSQLRISHRSEKVQIAGMPFEIEPRFEDRLLDQVWLASSSQCSNDAVAVVDELSAGLATKYPEVIFEEEFSRVDLSRANRNSRRSGQSVRFSRIYGSRDVAVVLTFTFSAENPPPYPGSGNRFALTLYQIARSNYRQRAQECAGTGNNRMDVALQYMTRNAFDARAAELAEEIQEEQVELVNQL